LHELIYFGDSETFAGESMKAVQGYILIKPEDLLWRPSNLMKIPNADYLERTGSENLGARLWRLPPKTANTLHKHIRAEEFYFVLEGVGRMRVEDETLTVAKYGGVLVGPDQLRQVFMTQMPKCFGSSWARQKKLNFYPVQRLTCRSFIRLIQSSCRKNWPAWNGRQRKQKKTKVGAELRCLLLEFL
jgi:mannose-6-phosphate isomerase-like protein (cupin superfamily)